MNLYDNKYEYGKLKFGIAWWRSQNVNRTGIYTKKVRREFEQIVMKI